MLKSPHPVEDVGSGTSSRLDRGAQLRESKERWIQKTYKTSAQIWENKKQRLCTANPRSGKPTKQRRRGLGFTLMQQVGRVVAMEAMRRGGRTARGAPAGQIHPGATTVALNREYLATGGQ